MKIMFLGCIVLLSGCVSVPIQTSFLSTICIEPDELYTYRTCHPITFTVNHDEFYIPAGFRTDLASIPRILWSMDSPAKSEFMGAAIAHDWLYRESCYFDRIETDHIFSQMLLNAQVPKWKAWMMYWGVRIFGGRYYSEEYCDWPASGLD